MMSSPSSVGSSMSSPRLEEYTMDAATSVVQPPPRNRAKRPPTQIQDIHRDILRIIFSSLDIVCLIRSSVVCRSWSLILHEAKFLQMQYCKQQQQQQSDSTVESERSLKMQLAKLAMERHVISLQEGPVAIYQWKNFDIGRVDKCCMKMGLVLTGGAGNNAMRLWSAESYTCLDKYLLPCKAPLVDFDFDESKVVGLVGSRLCIWRRYRERNMFSSGCEGEIFKGTCMRYIDPEAVVGCLDGRARIFDMYSRKWSQTIKIHDGPVTCLSLTDDQRIISGSSVGNITITCPSTNQRVATLRSIIHEGISTLCFNPCSHSVFAGSSAGRASCWDVRATRRSLWETRVSPNIIYSIHHLKNETSTLAIGGIDGVLRVVDQCSGQVISRWVFYESSRPSSGVNSSLGGAFTVVENKRGRKISEDTRLDEFPIGSKPAISCLAVGMQKVVTMHNDKYVRVWRFNN